jgi:hypothetical protein
MRQIRLRTVLLATLAYVIIGLATPALAAAASSAGGVKGWRLAAWILSIVVFLVHANAARRRGTERRSAALEVGLAVALSALVLAAAGPVRTHWNETDRRSAVVLSLFLWPLLTGVPACAFAWLVGYALDRMTKRPQSPPSGLA